MQRGFFCVLSSFRNSWSGFPRMIGNNGSTWEVKVNYSGLFLHYNFSFLNIAKTSTNDWDIQIIKLDLNQTRT